MKTITLHPAFLPIFIVLLFTQNLALTNVSIDSNLKYPIKKQQNGNRPSVHLLNGEYNGMAPLFDSLEINNVSTLTSMKKTLDICFTYANSTDSNLEGLEPWEKQRLLLRIRDKSKKALETQSMHTQSRDYFLSFCIVYAENRLENLTY